MAEYIEKQAAIESALAAVPRDEYYDRQIEVFINLIPPADVRPVKHGRWIKVGGFFTPGGDSVWQCSECRKGWHVYGIEHGTYGADVSDGQWIACPNCGADMREDET